MSTGTAASSPWADGFGGIVPQQQDLYAYRGRLLIESDADDALNIDVTKSHVHLSDEAREALDDEISEHRRISRSAWNGAFSKWKAEQGTDADSSANVKLAELEVPDLLPSEPDGPEAEERRRSRKKREETTARTTKEEEQQVKDEQARVILVDHLDDSVAWQSVRSKFRCNHCPAQSQPPVHSRCVQPFHRRTPPQR